MNSTLPKGHLFIIPTPVGNLEDITLRALNTLKQVDLIAAEDTRHTAKLLNHYAIHKPLISYHDHNENQQTQHLISQLQQGKTIALVSDGGTPLISDPGHALINALITHQIPFYSLPGPTALIPALTLSGLPLNRFNFLGFFPRKLNERIQCAQQIALSQTTTIIYESPNRIHDTLAFFKQQLNPNTRVAVTREISKIHEQIHRFKLSELEDHLSLITPLGEFTLTLYCPPAEPDEQQVEQQIQQLIQDNPQDTVKNLMQKINSTNLPKNKLYQLILKHKS